MTTGVTMKEIKKDSRSGKSRRLSVVGVGVIL
jgi:hypothetical protein